MKKTTIILMLIAVFSKLLGFGREITLSYLYGASNISDAYLIALTIPDILFSFIGVGIATGYIPMYSNIEKKYGKSEGNKYTNNLINALLVICTIIIIFGLIFTEQIVRIFASGFEGETLKLAVQFTKIGLVGIYFTGLISIFSGFLQLKNDYITPALVGFPMNILIILSLFISYKTNILVLSIGTVIATASQLILLIPFIHKKGYRYKFILNINDKHIKKMAYISIPIVLGASVNQVNVLVDRTIASSVATGGISALNYADRLNSFVLSIIVMSISTVIYPSLSKMAAEKNLNGLKITVSRAIGIINLLLIPTMVGVMIFAEPLVRLLFGRGAFDSNALYLTSTTLFFYSMGIVAFGLREILSRAFYSLQDTKTPMINAAISMVINIILNLILSKFMGVGGLALATSISAILCTILLFLSFKRKVGSLGIKEIVATSIKVMLASLIMGVISKLSYTILIDNVSINLSLIVSIIIAMIIYLTVIYFMKIEEVDIMLNTIKLKIKGFKL